MEKVNKIKVRIVRLIVGFIVAMLVNPLSGLATLAGFEAWPFVKKWLYT